MPILLRSEPRPTEVLCVCEVRVGVPRERLEEIQYFYTGMLRLPPWPEEVQIPGGWGIGDPQRGLYFEFSHDPEVNPVRRRCTLLVHSLAALEQRLLEQEWPYQRVHGFGFTDQYILLHDPVGHLVEIRQSQWL